MYTDFIVDHLKKRRKIVSDLLSLEKERTNILKKANNKESLLELNIRENKKIEELKILTQDAKEFLEITPYNSIKEIVLKSNNKEFLNEYNQIAKITDNLVFYTEMNNEMTELSLDRYIYFINAITTNSKEANYSIDKARINKNLAKSG